MNEIRKKIQKICWVYVTRNFIVTQVSDFKMVEAGNLVILPITSENYARVREFREEARVLEYRDKLSRDEVGYFAESDGVIVGSIWASLNRNLTPAVVRSYMTLLPGEALIHDIVTGEKSRGRGIGPFMLSRMASALLNQWAVKKVIVDVNFRNRSSLRMMSKADLPLKEQMLYISAFGRPILQKCLRHYA